MIVQKAVMDSSSVKTVEAQNCGGKCLNPNSEQLNLDVSWKIGAGCYKKKLIFKNASEVKQMIHAQIHELIEVLIERERELCLKIDEECLDLIEEVDINIAKLSGHCCNTADNTVVREPDESFEKDPTCHPRLQLDFKADLKGLKSRLKTFGNLCLHTGIEFNLGPLPQASTPFAFNTKENLYPASSNFEKWKDFNQRMDYFFRLVANDDKLGQRLPGSQMQDLNCHDDLYSMDPKEFERNTPLVEDDIEIISENEVAEIPSHSPDFPPKHASRRKIFSGKRSLPVLPSSIFQKNDKDGMNQAVEKQTEKMKNESLIPSSSSIIPNPESNIEVQVHKKENKNSVDSTETKKNQVPSVALASSLFEHFNNNKEEWLASKDDSNRWLPSESTSEKWLCPKDNSDKAPLFRKK